MDPIVVKDKDGKDVEIKDIQAFYDAHELAKGDLVSLRSEKKELEAQIEASSDDEVSKWRTRAIEAEAKSSLEADGVKDAGRIVKRLNLEGVSFDDEGNLSGFDESLSEFKADFPELFDVKKRAGRSGADIHENNPAKKELSPTELQASQVFG